MNTTLETPDLVRDVKKPQTGPSRREKALRALSFRNIGAVYVWALMVVVFAIWIPSTFNTWDTDGPDGAEPGHPALHPHV